MTESPSTGSEGQSSVLCPDGLPVYREILCPHNTVIQSSRLSIHIFQQQQLPCSFWSRFHTISKNAIVAEFLTSINFISISELYTMQDDARLSGAPTVFRLSTVKIVGSLPATRSQW